MPHLLRLIVTHLNLAAAPSPRTKPCSMTELELQATATQQQKQIAQQQKQIETLTAQLKEQAETFTAQLKEQATQIQEVSVRLEETKPALQVVNNP